ncbi:MAG TPA: (d)CMP kinase [Porphyromonadaceae bacterium]|nr:(d)CMP kinase [Porphyromonadaceae bacterium]
MQPRKIVIAIDGYASCGKSTMAKELARKIGYVYIDSGAMYRAVTLYCIEQGLFDGGVLQVDVLHQRIDDIDISFTLNPDTGRPETLLNGRNVEREIRNMAVSDKVSYVAAVGFVRSKLVALQQALGKEKGIVMDGRDIGTVVFPDAELKIFLTASPEVRARRRVDELRAKGQEVSFDEVLHNVKERDRIDETRSVDPLRRADDAILLDNSYMTLAQQDAWLMQQYRQAAGLEKEE